MKTESTKSLALLDTNILVYAYAENSPKSRKAAGLLADCFTGRRKAALSLQNIGEFCDVAGRKYHLPLQVIEKVTNQLLGCSDLVKLAYTGNSMKKAFTTISAYGTGFWDAMLAATMEENGVNTIYTEDERFSRIKGIKTVNPFK